MFSSLFSPSPQPQIVAIEGYLLLSGVLHAAVGAYLTYNKRKVLFKGPASRFLDQGKLALTGMVILAFIIVHLQHFRFGAPAIAGWLHYANGFRFPSVLLPFFLLLSFCFHSFFSF